MLFGGRNRLEPRKFVYHPRAYDPGTDTDGKERMRFESLRGIRYRRVRSRSPMIFVLLIIFIVLMIWMLNPNRFNTGIMENVTLDKEDVPAMTE